MITDAKQVSGLRVLRACRFNYELMAAIIALSDNWEEVLETIEAPSLIEDLRPVVREIRKGLGKE
jgi:hypothetical protein